MTTIIMKTTASEAFLGNGGIFHRGLIFMIKLSWQSRYRIPILVLILISALGLRLQVENEFNVNIDQRNRS
ncbi:hypothetical protein WN48_02276 [Eufriesea mexicana]|nr:hypothetical protein WN48_02276 [Eufriesea mexicana]